MSCDFPYINKNNTCTETYAQYLGIEYDIYHGFYICISIIITIISLIQLFRHWYYFRFKSINDSLIVIIICLIMSFLFIIQSIDPQGYNNTMPFIIENLASNFVTFCGTIIIFRIIMTYIKVSVNTYNKKKLYMIFIVSSIFAFIFTVIFSYLQVYHDRYLYRGIKLIIFALYISILNIYLNWHVFKMHKLFKNMSKTINNKEPSEYMIKLNNKAKKQLIYAIVLNIFMIFIITYILYSGIISLTQINKEIKPKLDADKYIIPLSQIIGIILALAFTGNLKEKAIEKNIEHNDSYLIKTANNCFSKIFGKKNDTVQVVVVDNVLHSMSDNKKIYI